MTVRRSLVAAAGAIALWPAPAASEPSSEVVAAAAATTTISSEVTVTVEVTEPTYDALQSLLDDEARAAMSEGKYQRAWYFFWRLLQIDPHDTRAMREAGRVAHALGRFAYAADTLAEVDSLDGTAPDPELHYLRGECLFALGRKADAELEWTAAERDLKAGEPDRRGVLWLARIAALRGELEDALLLYESLRPDDHDSAEYAEVTLLEVEAYIFSKDWATAERMLREFLVARPDHERGRGLLAWVLEARGSVDEALMMRALFAEDWTEHPRKTLEYARALERVYAYPEALDRYREARALGVDGVATDIGRLEHRLSPELAAGASMRGDTSGSVSGWMAGATLPISGRLRLAVTASGETSSGGITAMERTSTAGSVWGVFTGRRGGVVALAATVHGSDDDTSAGGTVVAQTRPRRVQAQVRADANQPWRESPSTIREGGIAHALAGTVYAAPWSPRFLFSLGGQARRLALGSRFGTPMTHADQLFAAAGLDVTLTSDPARAARGEILDSEMLWPRSLTPAIVLSYRHYELLSDDPFGARLVLVDRSSIDEVSGVVRRVIDDDGTVSAELRGGLGYDRERAMRLWRAGGSVLLSATAGSRLTLDYDYASESSTGLIGRRHAGSVVFHVDL